MSDQITEQQARVVDEFEDQMIANMGRKEWWEIVFNRERDLHSLQRMIFEAIEYGKAMQRMQSPIKTLEDAITIAEDIYHRLGDYDLWDESNLLYWRQAEEIETALEPIFR